MSKEDGMTGRDVWSLVLCLATTTVAAGEAAPVAARGAVRPILECVVQKGPDSYVAHFGYANDGSETVMLPAGPANGLSNGPRERGQPTSFSPGRSPRLSGRTTWGVIDCELEPHPVGVAGFLR